MSSRVGDESGFIDTQSVEIENTTDGLIYDQVLSLSPVNVDHSMNFHQLTNDSVDKTFGLMNASFDIVMMATQPEIIALFTLSVNVDAQLPQKDWRVTLTDQSNRSTLLGGLAVMRNFRILDTGLGSVQISFILEFLSNPDVGTQVLS